MKPKTTAIILVTVLLVALASLRYTLRSPTPRVNHNIYTSFGQVLAQEAAKALNDRGQIVVISADFHKNSCTVWREQWKAFTGELKKHPSISLVQSDLIKPSRIPLVEILNRYPQASALVYLVDSPDELDLEAVMNRPTLPKLIFLGNPDVSPKKYYGRFVANGILSVLILARPVTDPAPVVPPKTPREWFDKYYRIYTPQNFDTLPD